MGIKHFDDRSPYSIVQAPSIRDHLEHFTTLQEKLCTAQGRLDRNAHRQAKIDAGMATPEDIDRQDQLHEWKDLLETEFLQWCDVHKITSAEANDLRNSYLQQLKSDKPAVDIEAWISARANDIAYGRVRYTSGYRTTAPYGPDQHIRRLDWALIEPLSGIRTGSNDVSEFLYSPGLTFRDMANPIGTQE